MTHTPIPTRPDFLPTVSRMEWLILSEIAFQRVESGPTSFVSTCEVFSGVAYQFQLNTEARFDEFERTFDDAVRMLKASGEVKLTPTNVVGTIIEIA